MIDINEKFESDADIFAANILIPPEEYKKISSSKYVSDKEICDFAKRIGIVAGRLQHEGVIEQNRCSKLKVKYIMELQHDGRL